MDKKIKQEARGSEKKGILLLKRLLLILHPMRYLEALQTAYVDLKYGEYLGGEVPFKGNSERGWFGSQNSAYRSLSLIFKQLCIQDDDVIVDVGCGRGRVFNWLLNRGYKNKLIGIDVDVEIVNRAKKRLQKYKQINILAGAIEDDILPDEGTIFYLGNPFNEVVVAQFANQLEKKIKQRTNNKVGRPIIIYNICSRLHVFEENPFWKVTKLGHLTYRKAPAAIITPN